MIVNSSELGRPSPKFIPPFDVLDFLGVLESITRCVIVPASAEELQGAISLLCLNENL